MHIVAAKAVCPGRGVAAEFKTYAAQIVGQRRRCLPAALQQAGFRIVSGGTDII